MLDSQQKPRFEALSLENWQPEFGLHHIFGVLHSETICQGRIHTHLIDQSWKEERNRWLSSVRFKYRGFSPSANLITVIFRKKSINLPYSNLCLMLWAGGYISFSDPSQISNPSQLLCNSSMLLKSFSKIKPSQNHLNTCKVDLLNQNTFSDPSQISLIRIFPSPKNSIMRGPGVLTNSNWKPSMYVRVHSNN